MKTRSDLIAVYVVRPCADGLSHEYLQLRRHASDFMGGTWNTVMGTIEPGESAPRAALRELREEASLTPSAFFQLDQVDVYYIASRETIFQCVQFCAIVGANDAVVLNEEHDGQRWLPREIAPRQFLWIGNRRAIEEINYEILDGGLAKEFLRIDMTGLG